MGVYKNCMEGEGYLVDVWETIAKIPSCIGTIGGYCKNSLSNMKKILRFVKVFFKNAHKFFMLVCLHFGDYILRYGGVHFM